MNKNRYKHIKKRIFVHSICEIVEVEEMTLKITTKITLKIILKITMVKGNALDTLLIIQKMVIR